jgi:hypothetical protein
VTTQVTPQISAGQGWVVQPKGSPRIPPGATGEVAPIEPAPVFAPPRPPAPSQPNATLAALFLSLLGFLGVAFLLYEYKFRGVTGEFHGFPTRILFVGCLAVACTPYLLTIFRRVPFLFLALPAILLLFLYPIFSPYGLPYSRDPIFNYQFAQAILTSGSWSPTAGVTGQALTYSYYPGGAIFNGEVATLTNLPLVNTFNWGYDLFRLLVIPLAIYAIAVRLFGSRSAPLAVLLYLTVPSIENNLPTQQDFAVPFFLLAIVVFAYVASSERSSTFLRFSLLAFAMLVIISHHVSTYVLLGWLLGLAILPWLLLGRDPYVRARSAAVFLATTALASIWVLLVTLPVITQQISILSANITAIYAPATKIQRATRLGGITFPLYQEVWILAAIGLLVLLAILTLAETFRRDEDGFASVSILTGFLVVVLAIPFVSTGFSFLALRVFEFAGVALTPAAAWFLVHRLAYRAPPRGSARGSIALQGTYLRPSSRARSRGLGSLAAGIIAVGIVAVIVTGSSMVPLTTRDQFAPSGGILIDSPTHINENAVEAVDWAVDHLNQSKAIWGDDLVYDTFGGLGRFSIHYNSYDVFQPTNLCEVANVSARGQYIVTDVFLSGTFPPPVFPGTGLNQPNGTYLPNYVDVAKFAAHPQYFAMLYQNSVFTIYVIVAEPSTSDCAA